MEDRDYLEYITDKDIEILGDIRRTEEFAGDIFIHFDHATILFEMMNGKITKAYYEGNTEPHMTEYKWGLSKFFTSPPLLQWDRPTKIQYINNGHNSYLAYDEKVGMHIAMGPDTDNKKEYLAHMLILKPHIINGYRLSWIGMNTRKSITNFHDLVNYVDIKRPIDGILEDFNQICIPIVCDFMKVHHDQIEELGRVDPIEVRSVGLYSESEFFANISLEFNNNKLVECTGILKRYNKNESMYLYPGEKFKQVLDQASNKRRGELVEFVLNLGLYEKWEVFGLLL